MFRWITALMTSQHARPSERHEWTQDETQGGTQTETPEASRREMPVAMPAVVNDKNGAEADNSIVHDNEFNSGVTGEKLARRADSTTLSDDRTISPAIPFYNILFDRGKASYNVTSLKRKVAAWQALEAVPTCTLQDEQLRGRDFVRVRLEGVQDPDEGCFAQIPEIRALPEPDIRRLLHVAWLYRVNGRTYNSSHHQILLWDTVDGLMGHDDIGTIQEYKWYDACLTSRVCGKRQSRKWQEL